VERPIRRNVEHLRKSRQAIPDCDWGQLAAVSRENRGEAEFIGYGERAGEKEQIPLKIVKTAVHGGIVAG
jgi:hypothetical protein